jgi:DNA-binding XRE family transcriptional regulator
MSRDIEDHLDAIERHIHAAREGIDEPEGNLSVYEFRIPTGVELRRLRERCDLTREDVADRIDYSVHTLNQIENGRQPPGRELIVTLLRLYRMEWPDQTRYEQ